MVASTGVSTIAAANATKNSDAPKPKTKVPAVAKKSFDSSENDQVEDTFRPTKLVSRKTWAKINDHVGSSFRPKKLVSQKTWAKVHKNSPWARICSLSCFRGINAYLIMCIPQWYIAEILDFFLSGQPSDMKLGYGCSSVAIAVFFGGTTAIWTHYAITEPSNRHVLDHFPKGSQIWAELAQITLAWAVSEQVTCSLPLAMSRSFGLRKYAFDPSTWTKLDERGLFIVVSQFGLVFLFYLFLVASVSIPANMTLRRIHASMLPPEDRAIVPFHRANPKLSNDERASLPTSDEKPLEQQNNDKVSAPEPRSKLSVSEAWSTITWPAYFRVMNVYVQYFLINQLLQILYWTANWKLHEVFEAGNYVSSNLPSSPSPMVLPIFKEHFFG